MTDDFTPQPLTEILGETPASEPAPEPAPEPEASPEPAETPAETAVDDPVAEQEPAEAPAEKKMVPLEALQEERKKRQALEAAQKQPEPEPEKIDLWDDPEGAIKQVEDRFEKRLTEQQEMMQQQRISMSAELVKGQYDDYDDAIGAFSEAIAENPSLENAAINAQNPALEAYNIGKKHMALKEIGDPIAYKEKLAAEIRADLLKEMQDNRTTIAKEIKQSMPSDIVNEAGAATNKNQWSGPTPINQLAKGNNHYG